MGHSGRMAGKRLDSAQGFREGKYLEFRDYGAGLGKVVVVQGKRNHAAKVLHLARRDGMPWVILEAWVVNLAHRGVRAEVGGYGLRVLAMALHAHMKGFDSAQHQKAVHGSANGTGGILYEVKALGQCGVGHGQ